MTNSKCHFMWIISLFVINSFSSSSLADDQQATQNTKYFFDTSEEKNKAISGKNAYTISPGQQCTTPGSCIAEAGTLLLLSGRPKNLWVSTYERNPICNKIADEINKPLKANSFNNKNKIRDESLSIEYLFDMPNYSFVGGGRVKRISTGIAQHKVLNSKLYGKENANSYIRKLLADRNSQKSHVYFAWYTPLNGRSNNSKKILFSIGWQDLSLQQKKLENVQPIYLFDGSETEFFNSLTENVTDVFDKSILLSYDYSSNNDVILDADDEYDINIYDSQNSYFLTEENNIFFIENKTEGIYAYRNRFGFNFLELETDKEILQTPRLLVSTLDKGEVGFTKNIQCEFISRLSLWNATVAYRDGDTFLYHLNSKK